MHRMVEPFGASAATFERAGEGRAGGDADEDALLLRQLRLHFMPSAPGDRQIGRCTPHVDGIARSASG